MGGRIVDFWLVKILPVGDGCNTVGHCVTICAVHGRVVPPCRDHL